MLILLATRGGNDSRVKMAHIEGQSRYQATLFPAVADDLLAAEHPVRVIDAFVDGLQLAQLGFSKVQAEATGRSVTPGVRLSIELASRPKKGRSHGVHLASTS